MSHVWPDLRHGVRVLLRTPLFTICTIAALALGIGSTTALFSVVHAMLVKPLPYPDADRLVVIWEHNQPRNRPRNVVNPVNFMGWRDRSRSFEGMAAFTQNRVTLTGSGEPAELSTLVVTANLLEVLGVSPLLGRGFVAGEDQDAAARTMVLSHALWLRQFGGDTGVLGRQLTINGDPVTVIGVMPMGFEIMGLPVDTYTALRFGPRANTLGRSLVAMGRLNAGVTRDQAQSELESVMDGLRNERPDFNTGWSVTTVPLREQLVGDVRLALLVLFGAVAAVLLIACGNIGEPLRAAALYTDGFISNPYTSLNLPEGGTVSTAPDPDEVVAVAVHYVRDGRVGAVIAVDTVESASPVYPAFFVFELVGDRWLISEWPSTSYIEDSGDVTTMGPTMEAILVVTPTPATGP